MLFVWMQSRKLAMRILFLPSTEKKKTFLTERREHGKRKVPRERPFDVLPCCRLTLSSVYI
jgi:hypothetical protein